MKNTKNGFVTLLILIVIGATAIGGSYYYLTQINFVKTVPDTLITGTSTNKTAGLKTYTNTKYGFEFKYPSDTEIIEQNKSNSDGMSVTVLQATAENNQLRHSRFHVSVVKKTEAGRFITPNTPPGDCSICVVSWKPTKFLGFSGYEIESAGEGPDYTSLAIPRGDYVYLISHKSSVGDYDYNENSLAYTNDIKIRAEIFSTFKFTPQ